MEGIHRWLARHNFFAKNTDVPRTHTIMSGGMLFVADSEYDEFLTVYAEEIKRGNTTLSYSELRSDPVFKMYFDIDILDTGVLKKEYVMEMMSVVHRTMRRFFPSVSDEEMRCVVCATPTKDVEKALPRTGGKGVSRDTEGVEVEVAAPEPETPETIVYKKNGYHVIYPFVRVTIDMALQIRFTVVSEMIRCLGERPVDINPWSDVMDKAPYNGGLKMCGSVKTVKCVACDGSKKNTRKKPEVVRILKDIRRLRRKLYARRDVSDFDYGDLTTIEKDEFKNKDLYDLYSEYMDTMGGFMCSVCGDKGSVLEDRTYMPDFVLNADCGVCEDSTELLNTDIHEVMRWTSIRCPRDSCASEYRIPPGVPAAPMESSTNNMLSFGRSLQKISPGLYRQVVNSDMFGQDAESMSMWRGEEITDQTSKDLILGIIRSLDPKYEDIQVGHVFEMLRKRGNKSVSSMANLFEKIAQNNNAVIKPTEKVVSIVKNMVVRVHGTGSTYCCNKGSEHTTNNVYFWITPTHIYQRCFSRKDVVHSSGVMCEKYKGQPKKLPRKLIRRLFPEEIERRDGAPAPQAKRPAEPPCPCPAPGPENENVSNAKKKKKSRDWTIMY